VITQQAPVTDIITNDLILEINRFDARKIAAEAKAWSPAR